MGKTDKPALTTPPTEQAVTIQPVDPGVEETDAHLEGHGETA